MRHPIAPVFVPHVGDVLSYPVDDKGLAMGANWVAAGHLRTACPERPVLSFVEGASKGKATV